MSGILGRYFLFLIILVDQMIRIPLHFLTAQVSSNTKYILLPRHIQTSLVFQLWVRLRMRASTLRQILRKIAKVPILFHLKNVQESSWPDAEILRLLLRYMPLGTPLIMLHEHSIEYVNDDNPKNAKFDFNIEYFHQV